MNDLSLLMLEQERASALKRYELDEESIQAFRSKIQKVTEEEGNRLGKELFDLVIKKTFNDDYEKVLELVLKGANLEYIGGSKGNTALMICARKNFYKSFLVLVRAGVNIDHKNDYASTPTMTSARHGNKDILKVLILMGSDINAICRDGDNAIMSAKRHDQDECFQILYNANAVLNNRNLANQSLIEIPSKNAVDLSTVKDRVVASAFAGKVSAADTEKLIKEAEEKLLKFKRNT